jgi:HlyD family secretion protein
MASRPFYKSKKFRIFTLLVIVVALGSLVAFNATKDSRTRIQVQTQKASKKDLVSTVSASGEIKPKRYVNVSSDVPGRITRLFIKEGDAVRAGQPLCTIDATRFEASTKMSEAALQSSRADFNRSMADLDVAKLNFERSKKMLNDRLISDQAFDQAEAEVKMKTAALEALRRRINQLEAALDQEKDSLRKTTVISPMNGLVTLLQKEEGETVIGAQSFQPTVIMTVADPSVMEVEILVDETDIRNLALGQTTEVRVDALEDVKIKGEVTEIGASAIVRGATAGAPTTANTANQAKDFKVTVTLKDPPASLRPGLNATAEITTAKKEKVLAVPIQAVVVRELSKEGKVVDPGAVQAASPEPGRTDQGTGRPKGEEKEGVFVVSKGEVAFKPVKTGIMGETDVEVLDGLAEGDEIVSGSYRTLRTLKDKARVKVEAPKGGKAEKK